MVAEPLDWRLESRLWQQGYEQVAGMDEAGRGALAGVVTVALVVLVPHRSYPWQDSKTLSAKTRQGFADAIRKQARAYAIAHATPREIDQHNILKATHLAASRAIIMLHQRLQRQGKALDAVLSDYMRYQHSSLPIMSVVKADATSPQVAAASILAKVTRDRLMQHAQVAYPAYGFAKHKGYGTRAHRHALAQHGACALHRYSFRPVAEASLP